MKKNIIIKQPANFFIVCITTLKIFYKFNKLNNNRSKIKIKIKYNNTDFLKALTLLF